MTIGVATSAFFPPLSVFFLYDLYVCKTYPSSRFVSNHFQYVCTHTSRNEYSLAFIREKEKTASYVSAHIYYLPKYTGKDSIHIYLSCYRYVFHWHFPGMYTHQQWVYHFNKKSIDWCGMILCIGKCSQWCSTEKPLWWNYVTLSCQKFQCEIWKRLGLHSPQNS